MLLFIKKPFLGECKIQLLRILKLSTAIIWSLKKYFSLVSTSFDDLDLDI